ncbi:2OG-Fe(II) oxygenase [Pseudomonas sp. CGJS7]|uniref:2OG-Fe(II) oxygenase n=1 Tax=Pseudomonas sp. CGJS7 TaxID=3109348 RepID=UPI0030087883
MTLMNSMVSRIPDLGDVAIYDDIVPVDLQRSILKLVRRPIWAYGWKSVKAANRFCFWHAHFAGGEEDSRASCEDELAGNALAAPVHELWKLLSANILKGHEPMRVYANGHTYGVEGYVHTDSTDEQNYFTTIYYAHAAWEPDWAGETVFFHWGSDDISKAVNPKPGRVVQFRGATAHAARSPSRDCPELRICVVFKTQLSSKTV